MQNVLGGNAEFFLKRVLKRAKVTRKKSQMRMMRIRGNGQVARMDLPPTVNGSAWGNPKGGWLLVRVSVEEAERCLKKSVGGEPTAYYDPQC